MRAANDIARATSNMPVISPDVRLGIADFNLPPAICSLPLLSLQRLNRVRQMNDAFGQEMDNYLVQNGCRFGVCLFQLL